MAVNFIPQDNGSGDGFDVKLPKALKMTPKKKFTALVAKDFDFDHDHYNLHGQRVGLKLGELIPDIDSYVDGYVGCMECENSQEEVPAVSISSAPSIVSADEVIRSYVIYKSSNARFNFMYGAFSSEVCDKLKDIVENGISLKSTPIPTISVDSIPMLTPSYPMYSPSSPMYSPILPERMKTSTVPETTT